MRFLLVLTLSMPLSAGVESAWGLDVLKAIASDPGNVFLPPHECQLDGFADDRAPTRVASIRRTAGKGRITASVHASGLYYPAVQVYDTPGVERLRILLNGVERGVVVADRDDQRERLFFLTEPYSFRGGERLEFETLTAEGLYRIEGIYLLKKKPAARPPRYAISDILVYTEGRTATIGWITSWPVAGSLEWQQGTTGKMDIQREDLAARNHRIVRMGLREGAAYRFRVTARTREGQDLASDWQTLDVPRPSVVAGTARREKITLTAKAVDPEGASGVAFPVTSGVPFPRGALGSDRSLRLLDPAGKELPLQTSVLARWDDSTVKWALIDSLAVANQPLMLEYGSAVRPRSPSSVLRVEDRPGRVRIATGPLQFVISRQRFGLFESLAVDRNRDGRFSEEESLIASSKPAEFVLTDPAGTRFSSLAPPDEVVVEESGPVRATVRVSGEHRAPDGGRRFRYVVRVHAYAGQPYLRIQHSFENNDSREEFSRIRSLVLRLPLQDRLESWNLAGRQGVGAAALRQQTDDHYILTGTRGASGRRASGSAEWRGRRFLLSVAVRDFWQNYPKEIAVNPDGLELGLCPSLPADAYAEAKGSVDEHRLYYYLQDGHYRFRQGMSKTHEFWLLAGEGATPWAPLIAVAPPSWYVETKGFGTLAPAGASGLIARYDKAIERALTDFLRDRERDRSYGMMNFGDWWGERVINWGNAEYDLANALLLQFARTGDARFFAIGEQAAWHHRDVDTIQCHSDRSRVGGAYHHAIGHTGGYYAKSPVAGQGIAVGILTVDHVFVDGHLNYYFLTGDRRSLEVSRKIADRYDLFETRAYDFADARIAGWHLILTASAYQATRDPLYLNAAKIIVERALERQEANGGWNRLHICSHPNEPEHRGELGYMTGVMLAGLRRYYELTRDEAVARAIERGAGLLANEFWSPQARRFRYSSCPRTEPHAGADALNFLLLDGMVLAHQRTRDAALGRILTPAAERVIESMESFGGERGEAARQGFGKLLAMYACLAQNTLSYVSSFESAGAQ